VHHRRIPTTATTLRLACVTALQRNAKGTFDIKSALYALPRRRRNASSDDVSCNRSIAPPSLAMAVAATYARHSMASLA